MKSTFKSINHDGNFEVLGGKYFYDPAFSTTSRFSAKMKNLEFLGIDGDQKTFGKPQVDRLCLHSPTESDGGGCIDKFGFYMVFSNNPFAKLHSVSVIGLAPKGWRTNCGDQNEIDMEQARITGQPTVVNCSQIDGQATFLPQALKSNGLVDK